MKVNMNTEILDYEGNPIMLNEKESLKLGGMIIQALNYIREEDAKLSGEDKVHRAVVSQDVYRAMRADGIVDLLAEDVDLAKELMAELFNPLPLMRAYEALEVKLEEVKESA